MSPASTCDSARRRKYRKGRGKQTDRQKNFMRECCNPLHMVLPMGCMKPNGTFAPSQTLCITCLVRQFDQLPVGTLVCAIQDTMVLLEQGFGSLVGKQTVSPQLGDRSSMNHSAHCDASLPPWRLLLSFHEILKQLARKLCESVFLHHHVQLYKTVLALLSLLFTILKEDVTLASPCAAALPVHGDCLGMGESNEVDAATSLQVTVVGLAHCVCETVRTGLLREGESPAGLLLMTDLADMSPTFLRTLAEKCVPLVCNLLATLTDAYRVELVLYLLHQVFEACTGHPLWLEGLAETISRTTCVTDGRNLLEFLVWALETFRDEEPVVVNALSLARFLMAYETTRAAVLMVGVSEVGNPSLGMPFQLVRNLTLLLLHLNGDVVVAAAEALRELIIATRPFRECPDIADYVIESLRTASADSAAALVSLLNALPPDMVPAGPTLRVIFDLAGNGKDNNNNRAFEDAIKGPHFLASITDRLTNVNEVAQQIVRTVQNGSAISLHCFLLQLLCLEAACGGGNKRACIILPETVSMMANSLLHFLTESCGGMLTEFHARNDRELFGNRLASLRDETLRALFRAMAFLLPCCQSTLLGVAVELLSEALRHFVEWNAISLDDRFLVDSSTSNALLVLGSTVLENVISDGDGKSITDAFFGRQTCYLLQNDLLSLLLSVPGGSAELRARTMHYFIRLAGPNREDDGSVDVKLLNCFLLDDSNSPKVLLRKSFCQHPYWAASFLLALAVAGCPLPVEVHELDEFLFEQLSALSCRPEKVTPGGNRSCRNGNRDGTVSDERGAVVVLTALKTCVAYHRWKGELPRQQASHLDSCCWTGGVLIVPQDLWRSFFLLFRSTESSWPEAMASRDWGTVLLSILVSSAVLHIQADAPMERVETPYDHLFSGNVGFEDVGVQQNTLCRLVVRYATRCGLFLSQLFGAVRKLDEVISCRIVAFVCRCVSVSVGEGLRVSVDFIRLLLEQHVTPVLLYREVPVLAAAVARLVVLALAHLPISVASCCDHTLFRWAMQHVVNPGAQVYAWQIVFLLLERTHGGEFALRHDLELEAKLRLERLEEIPPCIEAVWATVRWMVEGAMRRHGVRRVRPIVATPLKEWAKSSSEELFVLRAFIISAVERCTRNVFPDAGLVEAAPMFLAWASEMFVRRCATVAAARLAYTLMRATPRLSASLEALGLFLQLADTGTTAPSTSAPFAAAGIEERAWVFAALLSAWPPWAASSGLRTTVDMFLSTLEAPQPSGAGVKRPRDKKTDATDASVSFSPPMGEEQGACRGMRALVDACERQSQRCGTFPLNRAKDFFLRGEVAATRDVNETLEVLFVSPHKGCELFFLR